METLKQWDDLTEEEMAVLEDPEVEEYILRTCAFAGIPLEVSEFKMPEPEDLGLRPLDVAYSVYGILFKNREDAERVASMPVFEEQREYDIGYDYKHLVPSTKITVKEEHFYRYQDLMAKKLALVDLKRIKEEFEKDKQAKAPALERYAGVRNCIWTDVRRARSKAYKIEEAKRMLERYVEIAKGDRDMAAEFFRRAYDGDVEIRNAVAPAVEVAIVDDLPL